MRNHSPSAAGMAGKGSEQTFSFLLPARLVICGLLSPSVPLPAEPP